MTMKRSPAGRFGARRNPDSNPPAGDPHRVRLKDERGQALAELALVLPVLLLVLLGMIDFGKAINYWIDNTHLANEGARLAAVNNNPASRLACSSGAGATLQDYILQQAESVEQRGCSAGTQRSTHAMKVAICFYKEADGSPITGVPAVGDTVEVVVTYAYDWLRGFPFPGSPSTTIAGKAAMRLEAVPTNYSTSANTGTCPSSA
jgi:Flp pilus assembly protein TadG